MSFLKIYFQIIIIFLVSISSAHTLEKTAFLDIDYILNESNYGKSITKELEKLNKKNVDILNSKEKIINEKKNQINKTKNISSKEKLSDDINKFNQEVKEYEIEKKKIVKEFQKIKKKKIDNFLLKINPLIQKYMKDNSIDILFDKNQIFMGSNKNDITNDILTLVNTSLNNG